MGKTLLIMAIACFALAGVIIVFGEGLRVYYSGGFFLLMGIVLLLNVRYRTKGKSA